VQSSTTVSTRIARPLASRSCAKSMDRGGYPAS
jgi:hypothetical protein